MAKLHINLGDTPNDRTGDPLRTAFEKVNSNFDELYARTGDDLQIPALAGNDGKVLTTNGTTLSWAAKDRLVNGDHQLVLNVNGAGPWISFPESSSSQIQIQGTDIIGIGFEVQLVSAEDGVRLSANATVTNGPRRDWQFGTDGILTLPGNGTINNASGTGASFTATTVTGISGDTKEFTGGGDVDTVTTSWTATGGGIVGTAAITNVNIGLSFTFVTFNQTFTATGPITFSGPGGLSSLELTPDGTTAWAFSSDGTLSSPNGSLQKNTGPVTCAGNTSTVVYTASGQYQHTIKLLIQVEGFVGANDSFDTQACEMIIAKSFRANNVVASVYGIVYTSQSPLATFTADWNALTSRIEVTCTAPGANSVNVKIFATEISTSD